MFKNYTSNDNLLLPPYLSDFTPQNDAVQVIHRIIENISLEELYHKYSVKGCPAYHPRMMLQILVYAYLRNIYSSRRIEEFCRNDIRFMWLTGTRVPDHNTINRFRSSRLKDVLKTVFATIVKFLVAEGFVSLDVACTDGTKMEANANRYTFVWGKSIHTRISRIAEQLEEIWRYAESVTKQELRDSAPVTYQDITPEKVERALEQIHEALEGTDADRKVKAKVRRVRKAWPEQLRKYESKERFLTGATAIPKTAPNTTCYESHIRFTMDMKLLRESLEWLYRYIYRHCRKHGIRSTRSKYRNEAESYLSYCKKRKRKASRTRTLKHRITRLPERFLIQRDEIHREYGTLLQYTLDYPNVFPSSKRFLYKKRKCLMGGKSVSHRQHLPSLHTHTSYCKRQRNKVCRVQCKDQQHTDR